MPDKKIVLDIEGMTCNHCKNTVRNALKDVKGVSKAEVDLANATASVEYDDEITTEERLVDAVNATGVYRVKEKDFLKKKE